jgi:uncharacterized membrane protein
MEQTFGNTTGVRSVDAGRGLGWWTDAWALFLKNPGMWIVLGLITGVIFFVLALIPILGGLALALLAPVFTASWMLTARKAAGGGALEVGDVFSAFKSDRMSSLIVIGALLLAVVLVLGVLMFVFGMGAAFGMGAGASAGSAGGAMAAMGVGMVMFLVLFVIGIVVGMAFWFAPGLVILGGMAPIDAIKASFAGSLKNIVPFILYTVIYLVAAIVASIPFGLGWLALLPLLMITIYVSYRDIFGA